MLNSIFWRKASCAAFATLFTAVTSVTLNAQTYQPPIAVEYPNPMAVAGGQSLHSSNYLFQDFTLAAYDDGNDGQVIWQHIVPGTNVINCSGTIPYTGGYSYIEVGALGGSPSGAPFTAFVAYHQAGVGHAVDLYNWDPFACTMVLYATHTLSTNPAPSRISMDNHIEYALALGWTDAGTLNTTVYETGIYTPSFIHTILTTINPNNVDVAFTHGSQLWVHYVYNSLGTPVVEVSAEDFWVMRAAGAPTTYTPVYEDFNVLSGASAGNVYCNMDGTDHGPDNWAYTYTEDHQNISVRLIDVTSGTGPATFVVNDGSMGNVPNNFSRNEAPILSYDFSFDLINVGWITRDAGQSYVGLEIFRDGSAITSALDYFQIPNNPGSASPTPVLSFSKMTEFSPPWLYAFFSEQNASGTKRFMHKYHDMSINTNFKTTPTPGAVKCPDYEHGGHKFNENHEEALGSLEVYPNPFTDHFTLDDKDMSLSGEVQVHLRDMGGKLIMTQTGTVDEINVALTKNTHTLQNGAYLLEVTAKEGGVRKTWKLQKKAE
ncbi:MAG: T9SS type A sorting domain-containing protein [Owenweeksia sp.]